MKNRFGVAVIVAVVLAVVMFAANARAMDLSCSDIPWWTLEYFFFCV